MAAVIAVLLSLSGIAPDADAARKLSLAEAIVLAKSVRSESARADVDLKIADVEILRAALQRVRLTANVSYTDGYQRFNVGVSDAFCASIPSACPVTQHEQLLVGSANLSIPIWSGLSVEASWTRAQRLSDAAEANRRVTWRGIALEAATAYWFVRRAELLLDTERRAHERNYQIMLITKARADAGIAPQVDYSRTRTSVHRQEAAISDLEGRVDQARVELGAALQVDGDIVLTEVPPESAETHALAQILADAEKRRPELQAAQASWEAQEQQVRIVRGAFWPQLSLFGNADARNQLLGIQQQNLVGSYSAGVKIDWTIFDSLTTYTAMRHEQLVASQLATDRVIALRRVLADVQIAYRGLKAAVQRRAPLRDALQAAQSSLETIRRRYEAGTALVIEVLQSQEELQGVEVDLINNSLDIAQQQVALDAARGAL
jgi:outer membrane protein TolC